VSLAGFCILGGAQIGQYLGYFNPGKKFFCFRVLHDCQIEAEIRNVGKWMAGSTANGVRTGKICSSK